MGGVVSLETSIKVLSLSGREAPMFTVAVIFPFKTCDVVDALPHTSCAVVFELFFNFVFILSFGGFDGSPEIVNGLFSIVRRKSDPICQRWAGEGFECVPEGGIAVVQYTISTLADGDVLKVFWSYCSEVDFIKVPRNNKRRIWVHGFLLTYIPVQFLECLVCVGLRGNVNSRDYDRCKFPR